MISKMELWAILKPRRTIKEIIASDMESNPSAVATTLPPTNPVIQKFLVFILRN
jgi:hypothetical protein